MLCLNSGGRWLRAAILSSTSAAALCAAQAGHAADVCPTGSTCGITKLGTAAAPAPGAPSWPGNGNGNKGGDGGNAGPIDLTLSAAQSYRESGLTSPVNLVTRGADGAQGSNATNSGFNKKGGDGGRGGDGGALTLNVSPGVSGTSGSQASGMTLATLGGDGGAAGIGNHSGPPGTAGVGGNGGNVVSTIDGSWTSSSGAGLFVQSQGGTGGRGRYWGVGYSATAPDGTTGGNGGTVNVDLRGQFGGASGGARIFSAGGNGGRGGDGEGGTGGTGGNGGRGGQGNNVQVSLSQGASIATGATLSAALWVQSLGGQGGNGGSGGSGGKAGAGGSAGDVTVSIGGGSLRSSGEYSPGLLAQSLGGTGASGGNGSAWAVGPNGGGGNRGGNAGKVTVQGSGVSIVTGSSRNPFGTGWSPGILAQSVGGGGGTGGAANGWFAIGGSGANAVAGQAVAIDLSGVVTTYGYDSAGVSAQSIGGGGGNGGDAQEKALGLGMTIGGTAGAGGNGGSVAATLGSTSVIETSGDHAEGMLLQSVGGGGGNGGSAYGKVKSAVFGASLSVGGSGGSGGAGDSVGFAAGRTTTNSGLITTSGADAFGILGQSIGGGGGVGGASAAIASTTSAGQYPSLAITVGVGGSGGTGGKGGSVQLGNDGQIATSGAGASGLVGESVGGGGGAGGDSSAQAEAIGENVNLSATLSVGGKGGSAGDGGSVSIANNGEIAAAGNDASGIVAQSIGGGGGIGGNGDGSASSSNGSKDLSAVLSIGGNGGGGGNGGAVSVTNDGIVRTTGDGGNGVLAQSIGGGGGTAGGATGAASGSYSVTETVGGIGGKGGSTYGTGPITIVNDGQIATSGADADAILAQSIGGGGGIGGKAGFTPSPSNPFDTSSSVNLVVNVGGSGGTGGAAGAISLTNSGSLRTSGAMSDAIVAQAIGGGGGKGGAATPAAGVKDTGQLSVGGTGGNGGNGGQPTVTNTGSIATTGPLAAGIVTQSIAGGGGIGGISGSSTVAVGSSSGSLLSSVAISVGGSGGANGTSGQTVVTNSGTIVTQGHDSIGIIAQSIAGGGGIAKTMSTDLDTATSNPARAKDYGVNLRFGGSGPSAGSSGLVNIMTQKGGDIWTSGDDSFGILAQSISGGGGLFLGGMPDGSNSRNFFGTGMMTGSVVGTVSVETAGNVITSGKGATAIYAQSIGGGGGLGGDKGWTEQLINFQPTSNHNGDGGAIAIKVDAGSTIATSGSNAPAIIAQSIGGGGGRVTTKNGAYNGTAGGTGKGGTVDLTIDGTVQATGQASMGIYAQSVGDKTSTSPITITIGKTGSVSGGPLFNGNGDTTPALYLDHGGMSSATPNQVINHGVLTSMGGTRGTAIYGNYGYVAVDNDGSITGAVKLANNGGSGSLTNRGIINAGTIALGGGTFTNSGVWSTAGMGGAATLDGSYVGESTSKLVLEGDFTANAPALAISGSAQISGEIELEPSKIRNGTMSVLTAAGGLSLSQNVVADPETLFTFDLTQQGNMLQATPHARFASAAAGLSGNDRDVAASLQKLWDSGVSADGLYSALAAVDGAKDYKSALDSISGQPLGTIAAFRYASSRTFADNLETDCQPASGAPDSCAWSKVVGSDSRQASTSDAAGYKQHGWALQGGVQKQIGTDLFLGGGLAYEESGFSPDEGAAQIKGSNIQLGASLIYAPGHWRLAGSLEGGTGWYRSTRTVDVGDDQETVRATPRLWEWQADARMSYEQPLGRSYVRPELGVSVLGIQMPEYREKGGEAFDLDLAAQHDMTVLALPDVEFGTHVPVGATGTLTLFGKAGAEIGTAGSWSSSARLADQPGSDEFDVSTPVPDRLARFKTGAEFTSGRWRAELQYGIDTGQGFRSSNVMARVAFAF